MISVEKKHREPSERSEHIDLDAESGRIHWEEEEVTVEDMSFPCLRRPQVSFIYNEDGEWCMSRMNSGHRDVRPPRKSWPRSSGRTKQPKNTSHVVPTNSLGFLPG